MKERNNNIFVENSYKQSVSEALALPVAVTRTQLLITLRPGGIERSKILRIFLAEGQKNS